MFADFSCFNRSHIEILAKQIVCSGVIEYDANPVDKRSFNERYKEHSKAMYKDIVNYFKTLGIDYYKYEKEYLLSVGSSTDKMFHLFFEAGIHCGLIFALDMEFIRAEQTIHNKINDNVSIVQDFFRKPEDITNIFNDYEKKD